MPPKKALGSFGGLNIGRIHILLAIALQTVGTIYFASTWVANQDAKNLAQDQQLSEQRVQIAKLSDSTAEVKQQLAVLSERTGALVENTREMKQMLKDKER